jgi:alpha-tubulin suppressor-like RCC1 family protein
MKTQIKQLLYGILATSCFGLSCTSCTLGPKEYHWPPKDGEPTVTLLGPVYEAGSETQAPLFKALEQAMTSIVENQQTHMPEFYQQRIAGMNHQLFRPGYSNDEEWGSIKSLSSKAEDYDPESMAGILESSENRKHGLEMAIRMQPISNQNPALVTLEGYRFVLQPSGNGQAEWFTHVVKLKGRKAGEAFQNALIWELGRPFTYSRSSVSAGGAHTCALLFGGTVKCWGRGSYGRLGNGSTNKQSTPVSVSGISTATSVSAGSTHTCAVLSGGTVSCWGYGDSGQLGNGSSTSIIQSTPVSVSNISTATSVSAGREHTCAVLSGGTVKCWGIGGSGRLGNGSTNKQSTPVSVSSISTATSVSAGLRQTCAVLSGGTVKCWGYGGYGQLGNGSTSSQTTPVSVSGISTATSVSAKHLHTCALLFEGTVKCWGSGFNGQLGNGSTSSQTTPVSVSNISTATSVSAGLRHTCAVLSGGTVKCWGYGGSGQLGNGSTTSTQSTPVSVSSISTATSVSAGSTHTCAVLSGGTVKCWGYGDSGQLGNGSSTIIIQSTPVGVLGF